MAVIKKTGLFSLSVVTTLLVPAMAQAHHVMDGQLPTTFGAGLLSGLGHPVIGADHLAFVIGVGLLAAYTGYRFILPLAFVAATLVGTGIHLLSWNLPIAETVIALSVAVASLLVIARINLPLAVLAGGFGIAGIFHGYAYGESIVGAGTTALSAYLIGFAVIQYLIAVGAGQVFAMLSVKEGTAATSYSKVAGGVMAGVAFMILSDMAFAV